MSEQPILYVKDKYYKISFSAEEFRKLEVAAKKRRLYVEEYIQMIVDENRKLDEEDFVKFRREVLDARKEVFEEEI